jgi:uncharacterized protein (DUF2336 family)
LSLKALENRLAPALPRHLFTGAIRAYNALTTGQEGLINVSNSLNEEDVARLLNNPDGSTRAVIAEKLASQHAVLNDKERKLAEDIFRVMVKDAEVRVRAALSRQLKENHFVPHDVAVSLARDVDEVSLPMLEFSDVLSDADLIEIVHSQTETKAEAVARRAHVSVAVSDALVDTGNEHVVATLVSNRGAELSEATFHKVVDEFASLDAVGKPLAERGDLPVTIIEQLMTKVSENIRSYLVHRQDLSPDQADALLVQAREMAVLGLSETEADATKLVDHLYSNGRLTPSIVLRAVCTGDMAFFEIAMAKLARIKVENARTLIHDAGKRGFDALYEKTELPPVFKTAMRAAIDVSSELSYDGGEHDRERFSRRMLELILTQYGDLGVEFEAGDLEYLLAKMGQLPPTLNTY